MRLMPFRRPTDYYDEQVKKIDEKICGLIKQRKEISNNNSGFPPLEYISSWAKKFDLYENLLNSIFGSLLNDKNYRPVVEPNGFRMNLPVLKSAEIDKRFFSVTFIRQYSNSSVLNLNIDWDITDESLNCKYRNTNFELFVEDQYDCRMESGGGGEGHFYYSFIVSPPLPDNISGIDLIFKEYNIPLIDDKPTGIEVVIHL